MENDDAIQGLVSSPHLMSCNYKTKKDKDKRRQEKAREGKAREENRTAETLTMNSVFWVLERYGDLGTQGGGQEWVGWDGMGWDAESSGAEDGERGWSRIMERGTLGCTSAISAVRDEG